MTWIFYALAAIVAGATSDIFRKLGSDLRDPFLSNLIFQMGGLVMAIVLWAIFSKKFEYHSDGVMYALLGGVLISIFTAFTFKALEIGPGVSTVMPVVRVGAVVLVALLGILFFKDKLTWNLLFGILLAVSGVYLIFSSK